MHIMRLYRLIPLTLGNLMLIAGGSTAASDKVPESIHLQVVSTATGNLFYQLECLTQRLSCSYRTYREFWETLGLDEGDERILQRFAATLDLYDTRARLGQRNPVAENTSPFGPEIIDIGPLPSQSVSLLSRIQIAAYSSSDADQLSDRLGLLTQPDDLDVIEATMDHFEQRFKHWWDSSSPDSLARFTAQLNSLLVDVLPEFLPAVMDFYAFDRTDNSAAVFAHLMPHPIESQQSTGTIIENHAVLEVFKDEAAKERLGVLVHELAHYFFTSAPIEWHGHRMEGALRSADPRAPAALALMNEALATAIGNGVLEEKLRGDDFPAYLEQPFYADDDVDAAAKAILPLVHDYLASNRPMDPLFINRYFSLVIERLGEKLDSLQARLRVSGYVAGDSGLYDAMNEVTGRLDTRSVWHANLEVDSLDEAVLTRHTYLNGVMLTSVRDRGKFSVLVPSIERLQLPAGSAAIACTTMRESGAILYVVMTDGTNLSGQSLVGLLEQATPCKRSAFNTAPRPRSG